MTDARGSTGSSEIPLFFDGSGSDLFGVLTSPEADTRDLAVVILGGAGVTPSIGRNAIFSRLAHALGAHGFTSLRFDYRGVGESGGAITRFRLDDPFVSDLQGAAQVLEQHGARRVALVGVCFGARTALAGARGVDNLAGVILAAPPVRDYVRGEGPASMQAEQWSTVRFFSRALRPRVVYGFVTDRRKRAMYRRWTLLKTREVARRLRPMRARTAQRSPFLAGLDHLVARGTPTLILYDLGSDDLADFENARSSGEIPDPTLGESPLEVQVVSEDIHTFSTLAAQDLFLELVPRWLARLDGTLPCETRVVEGRVE